jgi:hypothetical protein
MDISFYLYIKPLSMKTVRVVFFLCSFSLLVSSCSLFKKGSGCPTNGKNVGAEKVLDMSKKEQRKAGKFKA